jgi:hypothetical protein
MQAGNPALIRVARNGLLFLEARVGFSDSTHGAIMRRVQAAQRALKTL